jgi:hypothetical protein
MINVHALRWRDIGDPPDGIEVKIDRDDVGGFSVAYEALV